MGEELSRVLVLLIAAAVFVNVARGTTRRWFRAKFLGRAAAA